MSISLTHMSRSDIPSLFLYRTAEFEDCVVNSDW